MKKYKPDEGELFLYVQSHKTESLFEIAFFTIFARSDLSKNVLCESYHSVLQPSYGKIFL